MGGKIAEGLGKLPDDDAAERMRDDGPADVAEDGPAEVAEDGPAEVSEDGPAEVSEDGPAEVAEDGPAEVAGDGPAEVTEDGGPAEVTEDGPAELLPNDGPAEPLEAVPIELPDDGAAKLLEKAGSGASFGSAGEGDSVNEEEAMADGGTTRPSLASLSAEPRENDGPACTVSIGTVDCVVEGSDAMRTRLRGTSSLRSSLSRSISAAPPSTSSRASSVAACVSLADGRVIASMRRRSR
jgi:hypothetical protein